MTNTVEPVFKTWVKSRLQDPDVKAFSLLQTLWSGYGQCFRFFSPKLNRNLVAKAVQPPETINHPKGWNNGISHQRKLTSYQVERHFYKHVRARLMLPAPELIAEDQHDDALLLIMSDLDSQGFDQRHTTLTVGQAQSVLRYLAAFHATFLVLKNDTASKCAGLWPRGTYWHLATRQQELNAMPDSALKQKATAIDKQLADCPYQTIVHGDAKVANFCFKARTCQTDSVAAVDFQYPGTGVGVQDVAYFVGSALNEDDQANATGTCLDIYFEALKRALRDSSTPPAVIPDDVEKSWRYLYPIACADFQRFLEGWSPGHWKLNATLKAFTKQALDILPC